MGPGEWLTLSLGVAVTGDRELGRAVGDLNLIGSAGVLTGLELFGYLPPGTSTLAAPLLGLERQVGRELTDAAADLGRALFPP